MNILHIIRNENELNRIREYIQIIWLIDHKYGMKTINGRNKLK
jgi:hypothetical protein